MSIKPTNVGQLVRELGSGTFEDKLATMLSEVAASVIEHNKAGEVTIKFKLKSAGSANQVNVDHILAYKRPKTRGSISEDDAQETILYVNEGGDMSLFPANQVDMFHPGTTDPAQHNFTENN